jgi:hypothetical protein
MSGIMKSILCIRTGMRADNILPLIPGDCIAAAAKTLPDAEKDAEEFREAIVDVPGRPQGHGPLRALPLQAGKDEQMVLDAAQRQEDRMIQARFHLGGGCA